MTEKVDEIEKVEKVEKKQDVITMRQLLECGVHFGHQTKRWNPKMKRYIFTSRNGIHVIDLQQTIQLVRDAHAFVTNLVAKGGTVLFVGTKKQAQEAVRDEAIRCGMPYVCHRWLGGTLTNSATIRQSVNTMRRLDQAESEGIHDRLSSKEASSLRRKLNKLKQNLTGIKGMGSAPSALFVVDTDREQLAIKEAVKLGIPIIGVVDTNADPLQISHPIPANDDAIRAIKLIAAVISSGVKLGQSKMVRKPVSDKPKAAPRRAPLSRSPRERN